MHNTKPYAQVLAIAILFASCSSQEQPPKDTEVKAPTQEEIVQRGSYLVNTMGCADCHSPKVFGPMGPMPDTNLFLSGHQSGSPLPEVNKDALKDWALFTYDQTAAAGPWGVSFAANLTSDETGVGNWTEEQFITAMRKGKYKGLEGGRDLLPPMPWQNFGQLTDNDLKAMLAYLKTTKPIHNVVPAPIPPTEL